MNRDQLENIIKTCLKQDRSAQEKLYNFSYRKLMNVPMRYVHSTEEAQWHFNLGMFKVFESLGKFNMERAYIPWARTILIRSTIDELRKSNAFRATIRVVDSSFLEDNSDFDLNLALANQEYENIIFLLRGLPDKERVVFSLHEIDELTHEEIQDLTGIKINTSKWLLAKAKAHLKHHLTRDKIISFGK